MVMIFEVAFFKQVVSYVPPKKWMDLYNDSQSVHGFSKSGRGDCCFRRGIGILVPDHALIMKK